MADPDTHPLTGSPLHLQRDLHLFLAAALCVLLIGLAGTATADDLSVSVIKIREQSGYRLQRSYAGQLENARTSQLGFEFGGVVAQVAVREGDRVSEGQVLLQLAPATMQAELRGAMAQLDTARANVAAQQAQIELSSVSLQRYADLVARGHGSDQQLDELKSRQRVDVANGQVLSARLQAAIATVQMVRTNLDKLTIRAPYEGVVQARLVDEGSIVSPGQPVLTLVEDGQLEARIGVPEAMVMHLMPGTTYSLRVRGQAVPARLAAILPVANAATATVTALFQLEGSGLYAGTLGELVLDADVKKTGFWLPLTALAESQRGLWSVLAIKQSGETTSVEPRLVEIIHRGTNSVFVRGTLADTDLIVSGGTSRIVPGQNVRVAEVDDNYADQMAQR